MAGRHSKRQRTRAQVPVQRRAGIDLVDVVTKLAHKVSPDELLAGRARGDYQGFCGERFRAASMVEPGRGPCQRCRERAVS